MYAFAQRGDTAVVDEPLYAHYLVNVETGEERPYKDELLAVQEHSGHLVMANLLQQTQGHRAKNLFAKHMAKQRQNMDLDPELHHAILAGKNSYNVILARQPLQILSSYKKVLGEHTGTSNDVGLVQQLEVLHESREANRDTRGGAPSQVKTAVVVYEDMITQPRVMLQNLCRFLDLPFDEGMMTWDKGGRPEDGLWAPWWYSSTHSSTGFSANVTINTSTEIPPRGENADADLAVDMYEELYNCDERLHP